MGKPKGKRPLGRPSRMWEDNIKMDLREVGGDPEDWMLENKVLRKIFGAKRNENYQENEGS